MTLPDIMLPTNNFAFILVWVIAFGKCQNLTQKPKHHISTEDFNELSFFEERLYPSVAYSSRVKRQLNSGTVIGILRNDLMHCLQGGSQQVEVKSSSVRIFKKILHPSQAHF